ncbi:hypothetical protein M433DRAFT_10122 [Acidomyces richmondensis BFW]|nr:hypothetical protein M433DRAFT_10122 [Acidomyces richmondensis BFW]
MIQEAVLDQFSLAKDEEKEREGRGQMEGTRKTKAKVGLAPKINKDEKGFVLKAFTSDNKFSDSCLS